MGNGGVVAKFSLILLGSEQRAVGCVARSGGTDSAFVMSSACYRPLIDRLSTAVGINAMSLACTRIAVG